MASEIPIHYKNKTHSIDFEVVVFTKNYSMNTPKNYYVAWQVLRGQTSVKFDYPVSISVGATYDFGDQTIIAGPFNASLGSTWNITQDKVDSTAALTEDKHAVKNPNGTIVIKNNPPSSWSGRFFDIGIYKSDKLLVVQKDVHVGDQVDFMLQPKLYFGVVRNMKVSNVFTSLEVTQALTEFDLSDFPNGMIVSLTESAVGGQYKFTAIPM